MPSSLNTAVLSTAQGSLADMEAPFSIWCKRAVLALLVVNVQQQLPIASEGRLAAHGKHDRRNRRDAFQGGYYPKYKLDVLSSYCLVRSSCTSVIVSGIYMLALSPATLCSDP